MNAMILSTDDISNLLNVSPRNVMAMDKDGAMPPSFKLGRLRRWTTESIESWVRAGCPRCPRANKEPAEAPK